MSRVSLQVDLYMICENQIFVANVVVINPTWKTVVTSVINWPTGAATKLSIITKIHKYRKFHDHDGHHFIPMAMKVHNTPRLIEIEILLCMIL
jgi:hypothetical protein